MNPRLRRGPICHQRQVTSFRQIGSASRPNNGAKRHVARWAVDCPLRRRGFLNLFSFFPQEIGSKQVIAVPKFSHELALATYALGPRSKRRVPVCSFAVSCLSSNTLTFLHDFFISLTNFYLVFPGFGNAPSFCPRHHPETVEPARDRAFSRRWVVHTGALFLVLRPLKVSLLS